MAASWDTVVTTVVQPLRERLNTLGFEVYPLKIGWYNAVVSQAFQLQYSADTVVLVVLSTPSMFEKVFLPFLRTEYCNNVRDPIDQCVDRTLKACLSECLPDQSVEISFDFEMLPNRKPKFLAQTAAHVAGAAYYYQASEVQDPPWGNKKMFGVCIHPRFGGWFAIRALLVLKGIEVGEVLQQTAPPDCVSSREARIELLERFNLRWHDWTYRDIIPTEESYSPQQREYFSTPPGQRAALLKRWGFLTQAETETQTTSS